VTDTGSTDTDRSIIPRDSESIDLETQSHSIYECEQCGTITLALVPAGGDADLSCHGTAMTELTEVDVDTETPDLRQVLLDVFDLPKPGIDICLCVISQGPVSAAEIGDMLEYETSTVSRYLNDLVEIGLLEKSQLNRQNGGYVNVYHSIDIEEMRRETLLGFYAWAGRAASLIEGANLQKEQYLSEGDSGSLRDVFWSEFSDDG